MTVTGKVRKTRPHEQVIEPLGEGVTVFAAEKAMRPRVTSAGAGPSRQPR